MTKVQIQVVWGVLSCSSVTPEVFERVMNEVMRPTVDGMAHDGHVYTGFLYAGLMIDEQGQPRVIDFNCHFR